jgi:glycosyltransferase involved in cell wall biosynthesis
MRILMVSPHPVYTPRGTPISVLNRCRALGALGHEVELVTYPIGEDVAVEGLRYRRARALPGAGSVGVGPSPQKLALDLAVGASALRCAWSGRHRRARRRAGTAPRDLRGGETRHGYDVVHTHEEAGLIGPALASLLGVPHVYDMGNDWTAVLENYGLSSANPLVCAAGWLERAVVRRSSVVIAHFPSIASSLGERCTTPVHVAFNVPLDPEPAPGAVAAARRTYAGAGERLVVYTGTLEAYQGIDLLLEAVALLAPRVRGVRLVVAGGDAPRVAALSARAGELGCAASVGFAGRLAPAQADALVRAADVAVSPRLAGSNTPLKLFAYLRAGTPIVATDTLAHRQALDDSCAVLVEPDPPALAEALAALLTDPARAERLRHGALERARSFAPRSYLAAVGAAYRHVGAPPLDDAALAAATDRLLATGRSADA